MERDYRKLYEEAFKRAKEYYDNVNTSNCERRRLETIFPELKESEDERIRKEIIAFLKENLDTGQAEETWSMSGLERWITWLEKQSDQKTAEWSEEDEYQINTILHGLDLKRELYKKEGNKVEEERYSTQHNWLKSLKEKYTWKPSEEQMEAIKYFIDFRRPHANASTEGWSAFKHLESLYNALEKL